MGFLDKFSKKKGAAPKAAPAKTAEKADKDEKAPRAEAKADAAESPKPVTRGPLAKEDAGIAHRILLRPVHTEKTGREQGLGKYVFLVAMDANKVEVARAVRDLYGVKPVSVRIVKVLGKSVRFGRTVGKEKDRKKAIVTLKPGETITVVEGA